MRLAGVALILVLGLSPSRPGHAHAGDADKAEGIAFFETRIRPVLVEKCYACHSSRAEKLKGGLRLDTRAGVRGGGDSGPAIVPGKPEESTLLLAIAHTDEFSKMPPKEKLPDRVIADFHLWVEMGAPDPREAWAASPEKPARAESSKANTDWWSLRRIADPPVPTLTPDEAGWARTPIDAFILAGLRAKGLKPSPQADRRTLIRRLSFDLTGLPPTPDEIDVFLADAAPDAYERLVDRLLASPHHGERWARHWMDLVHFAETHGHDQDRIRPNAWPYRDYLIASFNRDTPYSRFIQEQVAADALFPDEPGLAVALGMVAAGPWDESSLRDIRDDSIDRQIGFYIDRDDMVSTVISSFASLTVHCARCHDHKFDPITQEEYYGLQAVFAGVDRAERPYDPDPETARRRRSLEAIRKALAPSDPAFMREVIDRRLAELPHRKLVYAAASDFAPDGSHKPPGGPRPVQILRRGDIHKPGPAALPGALSCIAALPWRFAIADPKAEAPRRVALAKWLSDPRNPLVYRSIVNRAWQHHFGRGIVETPSDFGRMGSLPSHPELLDWLASRFLEGGTSPKALHRLIVTSAVYRQATRHDPSAALVDAENRLLWRQNRRRLDAESVHDAILVAAGRLERTMGGPSVRQFALSPGVHVTPVVDYTKYDWAAPGAGRRSVYRFLFRTLPDPFMDTLDEADASQLTAARTESITPLQALAMLNNPFVLRMSEHLAQRVESQGSDVEDQVRTAILLAYGREATPEELIELSGYAQRHGLANLGRLLFNSNEFLFVN
jgi:hypothetical protein